MRLRSWIAAAGVVVAATAISASAGPRPTVLGVTWEGNGLLSRLDARTLAPVGRRLNVGKPPLGVLARSPDGRVVALGHGSVPELRFVDLRTLRQTGRLRLPGLGSLLNGIWPSPRRLVALHAGVEPAVLVVDPQARRVLERRALDGEAFGAVAVGRKALLVLLSPRGALGPARLAVVDAEGDVRTVALPGVSAGFAPPADPDGTGRQASPGVAADPAGRRAVVVTPDLLVTVDLGTLEVTQQRHVQRRSAKTSKRLEGWGRRALWLGSDTIAVSGWTLSTADPRRPSTPAGVTLVRLGGRSELLDSAALGAELAGATLLVYGGAGLRGYHLDGRLRFELLRGRDTGYVQAAGRWAYVGSENSTRFVVVDVGSGRIAGVARTPAPTIVLARA